MTSLSLLLTPAIALGQAADPPAPAPRVHVVEQPGASLVAITVLIPAGSADDPQDAPGTARLLAETIARSARDRMDPDASQLNLRVERSWSAFTLLSTPDAWADSWAVLEEDLFVLPIGDALSEAARAALAAQMAFEDGAPVREFERELYRTMVGAADPWSRDPRGTPAGLRSVGTGSLTDFRSQHYIAARATAAAAGPLRASEVIEGLAPIGTGVTGPGPTGGELAWHEGERLHIQREVTNAWIGAVFPAPLDLPRTHLEFIAFELEQDLNPLPPSPGLFSATVHIEDTPRGPVLVARVAVVPEATDSWERRVLTAVRRLRSATEDVFFRWERRRFRSAILLADGVPEDATLRMALDLLREKRVRPLREEVWGIGPDDLAAAADRIGEPRILLIGPDLPRP